MEKRQYSSFWTHLFYKRVASSSGNAAHVVQVPGHSDVARLAPRSAPAVLDEPEVGGRVAAVADDEHAVVERLTAVRARVVDENALLVEHEVVLGDVDGH